MSFLSDQRSCDTYVWRVHLCPSPDLCLDLALCFGLCLSLCPCPFPCLCLCLCLFLYLYLSLYPCPDLCLSPCPGLCRVLVHGPVPDWRTCCLHRPRLCSDRLSSQSCGCNQGHQFIRQTASWRIQLFGHYLSYKDFLCTLFADCKKNRR